MCYSKSRAQRADRQYLPRTIQSLELRLANTPQKNAYERQAIQEQIKRLKQPVKSDH